MEPSDSIPEITAPASIRYNADGLVPVIAQDSRSGQVLMLAWMNAQSLAQTLAEGRMVYWSRSRNALWRKGDTSGHTQKLVSLALDCDGDTLLARVEQTGAACHTGNATCFFTPLYGGPGDGQCAAAVAPRSPA